MINLYALGGILLADSIFKGDTKGNGNLPLGILKGSGIGVGVAVILALVFTAVALMTEDPDKLIGILAYAALFIGALAAGIAAPRQGIARALSSALSGAGYALIIWLASIFFRGSGEATLPFYVALILYIACVGVSTLGGLIFGGTCRRSVSGKKNPAALIRKQLGHRS